jgi:hypothetical protein
MNEVGYKEEGMLSSFVDGGHRDFAVGQVCAWRRREMLR